MFSYLLSSRGTRVVLVPHTPLLSLTVMADHVIFIHRGMWRDPQIECVRDSSHSVGKDSIRLFPQ